MEERFTQAVPGPRRHLEPEDVLVQDFKHPDTHQILLPGGTVLTENYVRKIRNMGLEEAALECLRPPADRRLEALELARGLPFEYALYLEGKRVVEDLHECARPQVLPEQREHVWSRSGAYMGRMADHLLSRNLEQFVDYRIYDAYRYSHPINTATLSMLVAQASRIGRDRMVEIGMAGLLCDLGKTRVPFTILSKPGKLDPDELAIARSHCDHSRTIVEQFRWAAGDVVHVAQHHHERYDGSGYPKQLQGRSIGEFARIVGLADAYDAMLSDVPYRQRMEPAVAFRLVTTNAGFDPAVVAAFSRRVSPYPRGMQVRLSNGREGIVCRTTAENAFRPAVIVDDYEVDLATEQSLRITGQFVPRRYHRTAVMLPVRILGGGVPERQGQAVNISLTGLCVESEQVPPQGEPLAVILPVLGGHQQVKLTGYLTWVRHGEGEREKTTYGLSITPSSAEDNTLLVDLILGLP